MSKDHTIACYYFPNYHVDPRNEAVHGPGSSEWELVKRAEPRFEGHRQPRVPAWGYEDESDPAAMARKIDAAADHGLDAFIFDWTGTTTGRSLSADPSPRTVQSDACVGAGYPFGATMSVEASA